MTHATSHRAAGPSTRWRITDCGCCAGIMWGGEYPRECRDCNGSGLVWILPTGQTADYPGGRFSGSRPGEYEKARPWSEVMCG
jgi:hypothetical protein